MVLFCIDAGLPVNWDAIAAIGQAAGALFTAIAVAVALHSARSGYTPRVDVQITSGALVQGPQMGEYLLLCNAVNIGPIDVKMESCILKIPRTKKEALLRKYYQDRLPAFITPGNNFIFDIPVKELAQLLKNQGLSGKQTLLVQFLDSRGKRYTGKNKIELEGWLD